MSVRVDNVRCSPGERLSGIERMLSGLNKSVLTDSISGKGETGDFQRVGFLIVGSKGASSPTLESSLSRSLWKKTADLSLFSNFSQSSDSLIRLTGLEKTPVRSSGTSRFSLQASNFLFFLAPWARTQASRSQTKFLIRILRRKVSFRLKGNQVFRWRFIALFCWLHDAHSCLRSGCLARDQNLPDLPVIIISFQGKNSRVGNENAVFIS